MPNRKMVTNYRGFYSPEALLSQLEQSKEEAKKHDHLEEIDLWSCIIPIIVPGTYENEMCDLDSIHYTDCALWAAFVEFTESARKEYIGNLYIPEVKEIWWTRSEETRKNIVDVINHVYFNNMKSRYEDLFDEYELPYTKIEKGEFSSPAYYNFETDACSVVLTYNKLNFCNALVEALLKVYETRSEFYDEFCMENYHSRDGFTSHTEHHFNEILRCILEGDQREIEKGIYFLFIDYYKLFLDTDTYYREEEYLQELDSSFWYEVREIMQEMDYYKDVPSEHMRLFHDFTSAYSEIREDPENYFSDEKDYSRGKWGLERKGYKEIEVSSKELNVINLEVYPFYNDFSEVIVSEEVDTIVAYKHYKDRYTMCMNVILKSLFNDISKILNVKLTKDELGDIVFTFSVFVGEDASNQILNQTLFNEGTLKESFIKYVTTNNKESFNMHTVEKAIEQELLMIKRENL